MEYEKIKEFGEAIKSGILILPDEEEEKMICLEKGSGEEVIRYIGIAIANLANAADVAVLDVLPDIIREAVNYQKLTANRTD